MKKILLLLIGLPGSGKTTIANFLSHKFKAKVFHSGNIIRQEIKHRRLAYTPANDMKIANWFHTGGRDILIAEKTYKAISKFRNSIIIVEGFRNTNQYNYLLSKNKIKKKFSKIILLAVSAPFKIRAARELGRGRFSKGETLKYLQARDLTESRHGLKRLIAKAKYKINSSGSLEETEKKAKVLIKKLIAL